MASPTISISLSQSLKSEFVKDFLELAVGNCVSERWCGLEKSSLFSEKKTNNKSENVSGRIPIPSNFQDMVPPLLLEEPT